MSENTETEYRVVENRDAQGRLLERTWKTMQSDAAHRLHGPAVEKFDPDTGNLVAIFWIDQRQGGRHREGSLPAFMQIDPKTGVIYNEEYCMWGMPHRDDGGPTKILRNCSTGIVVSKEFHVDGRLHRGHDLPAIMEFDEDTGQVTRLEYYQGGVLHRNNGPAIAEFDEDGKITSYQHFQQGKELPLKPRVPSLTR